MDAKKSDPAKQPEPRVPPFRIEAGDGSEPPRLVFDFMRFKPDDDSAALRQRVASLEAQLNAMASTISALQSQIDTLRG